MRPILSIAVTETVVRAQGSLWWDTETMGVESGSHQGQTILLSAHTTSTCIKHLQSLLSYLWHYNRYFAFTHGNSTHPTQNHREDIWHQKLVATMNTFTMGNRKMTAVSVSRLHTRLHSVSHNLKYCFMRWPWRSCLMHRALIPNTQYYAIHNSRNTWCPTLIAQPSQYLMRNAAKQYSVCIDGGLVPNAHRVQET